VLIVNQLILNYGKYTAYSGVVWHHLEDCDVASSAAQNAGAGLSSRQLGIW
jgi:hypothetical protein